VHVQHEVSHAAPPNLNLSAYGYSVNAAHTTRQKALYDALRAEGMEAVRNRLVFLVAKYEGHPDVAAILIDDYEWLEHYYAAAERRHQFDTQRERTRQKIRQRMAEKSRTHGRQP